MYMTRHCASFPPPVNSKISYKPSGMFCLITALFQVVHHIHEWMAGKLQTYCSRDTEYLNHNTWTINCNTRLFFLP